MTKAKDADGTILNLSKSKEIELPIKTTVKVLTQTSGRGLKQHTRATKGLIDAVMFGFPYVHRWEDDYVSDMLDDLMCLAIGMDGQGRKEQIDCLNAGGQLPDAYYNNEGQNKRGDTAYVRYVGGEQ